MNSMSINRKAIPVIVLSLVSILCYSQKQTKPSDEFVIEGRVKQTIRITLADILKEKSQKIPDIVITNHLGEKKSDAKGLSGVLLKDLLSRVELDAENPKILSEFFFVVVATDGYKVVYSWNELFNSDTGNHVFVITEKNGRSMAENEDRILIMCTSDRMTGRRNVKGVVTIKVLRV